MVTLKNREKKSVRNKWYWRGTNEYVEKSRFFLCRALKNVESLSGFTSSFSSRQALLKTAAAS